MRTRRILPLLLTLATIAALTPTPARAQAGASYPSGLISSSHGRAVFVVYHPTNRSWFVEVAVDVHFGYNTASADADAEFASPVGRISKGSGAPRVQHEGTHLGYESGQPIVRDFRPILGILGQPRNRQNGLSPAAYINSGTASQVLASQDWRRLSCTDDQVAARFYFSIRWADGSLTRTSRRSNYVEHDLNGCNADVRVTKAAYDETTPITEVTPGQRFAYQLNVPNTGPDTATGVVITDVLPAGLTNVDVDESQGCTYAAAARQVTCVPGVPLRRGFEFIILVGATVASTVEPGTELTNAASVRSDVNDPNTANNTTSLTLDVVAPPAPT
jgi:uncharacterized repeat protein (TIGR01451 family)